MTAYVYGQTAPTVDVRPLPPRAFHSLTPRQRRQRQERLSTALYLMSGPHRQEQLVMALTDPHPEPGGSTLTKETP